MTKTSHHINLDNYTCSNIGTSDEFQMVIRLLVQSNSYTMKSLAEAMETTVGKVTYHAKKLAVRGKVALSKELINNRLVLVVRACHVLARPTHKPVTVEEHYARLTCMLLTPDRMERGSRLIAYKAKRSTHIGTLLGVASALVEEKHAWLADRMGNKEIANYHRRLRGVYLKGAKSA